MAGSAIVTASHYEDAVNAGRYPDLAARGEVPDLLSDPAAGSALGAADITALSGEWEPIGLGAITDLVQHAFGPVDLDRSPVELATVTAVHRGCPACAGGRFGFPGALAESRATMCPTHLREAESVIKQAPRPGEREQPGRVGGDHRRVAGDSTSRTCPTGWPAGCPSADSSLYVRPRTR